VDNVNIPDNLGFNEWAQEIMKAPKLSDTLTERLSNWWAVENRPFPHAFKKYGADYGIDAVARALWLGSYNGEVYPAWQAARQRQRATRAKIQRYERRDLVGVEEKWRNIPNFEDYMISNYMRVRRGYRLLPPYASQGKARVQLYASGKREWRYLVALWLQVWHGMPQLPDKKRGQTTHICVEEARPVPPAAEAENTSGSRS